MTSTPLDALLDSARDFDGGDAAPHLRNASGVFLKAAAADPALLRAAAEALPTLSRAGTCWVAVVLGAAVERGAPADAATPALVDAFRAWLDRLPVLYDDDEELPPLSKEQQHVFELLPQFAPAVVSHLARSPSYRHTLAQDEAWLARLDQLSVFTHATRWVHEAVLRTSGVVTLLHVPGRRGLRLRYENVGNCFHLFSLLQNVVGKRLPGGRSPLAGENGVPGLYSDLEAWWHYGHPASPTAEVMAMIWGEGRVRDLPRVDGEQVILLWQSILKSRTWNEGFLSPELQAMPPGAAIDGTLSDEEFATWMRKLGIAPEAAQELTGASASSAAPRRPWWKFW